MDDLGALAWKSVGLNNPPSSQDKSKTLNALASNNLNNRTPTHFNNSTPNYSKQSNISINSRISHQAHSNLNDNPSSINPSSSPSFIGLQQTTVNHTANSSPLGYNKVGANISQGLNQSISPKPNYMPVISNVSPSQFKNSSNLDPFASLLQLDSNNKNIPLEKISPKINNTTLPSVSNSGQSWSSSAFSHTNNYHPKDKSNSIKSVSDSNKNNLTLNDLTSSVKDTQKVINDPWDLDILESKGNLRPGTASFLSASLSSGVKDPDVFDLDFFESKQSNTLKDSSLNSNIIQNDKNRSNNGNNNVDAGDDLFAEFNRSSFEENEKAHHASRTLIRSDGFQKGDNVGSNSNEVNSTITIQKSKKTVDHDISKDAALARLLDDGYSLYSASTALSLSKNDYQKAFTILKQNEQAEIELHDSHFKQQRSPKIASSSLLSSTLGLSFMNTARKTLESSKKKLTEVVGKAQETLSKQQNNSALGALFSGKREYRDQDLSSQIHYDTHSSSDEEFGSIDQKPSMNSSPHVRSSSLQESFITHNVSEPVNRKEPRKKVVAPESQVHTASQLKEQGNSAFKSGQYADAIDYYTQAIHVLPQGHDLLVNLYNNRASSCIKTGEFKKTVQDTTSIIDWVQSNDAMDEFIQDVIKAYMRRALAYENMEKWAEAKSDYEILISMESSKAVYDGLARCQKALSIDDKKDLYNDGKTQINTNSIPASKREEDLAFDPFDKTSSYPHKNIPSIITNNNRPPFVEDIMFDSEKKNPVVVTEAIQTLRLQATEAERRIDQKVALQDQVDARIIAWQKGKETNLRALLATLDQVLWPELDLKKCTVGDLIQPNQVKIRYMRSIAKIHPDKLSNTTTLENQMIASSVFTILTTAWDEFKEQNGL